VVYNSSPSVASVIEGVPVFITDPSPEVSQSHAVANTDINTIETPKLLDRQAWVEKLAMCHWNFNELSNGSAWKYMRTYL
jgi:hypothetical protein